MIRSHVSDLKSITVALMQTVRIMGNVLDAAQQLSNDEAGGLLKVITDYTYALDVLDKYDQQRGSRITHSLPSH